MTIVYAHEIKNDVFVVRTSAYLFNNNTAIPRQNNGKPIISVDFAIHDGIKEYAVKSNGLIEFYASKDDIETKQYTIITYIHYVSHYIHSVDNTILSVKDYDTFKICNEIDKGYLNLYSECYAKTKYKEDTIQIVIQNKLESVEDEMLRKHAMPVFLPDPLNVGSGKSVYSINLENVIIDYIETNVNSVVKNKLEQKIKNPSEPYFYKSKILRNQYYIEKTNISIALSIGQSLHSTLYTKDTFVGTIESINISLKHAMKQLKMMCDLYISLNDTSNTDMTFLVSHLDSLAKIVRQIDFKIKDKDKRTLLTDSIDKIKESIIKRKED